MKVLVLGGGNSLERDVSLRSSAAVTDALVAAGFDVKRADPQAGFGCLDNLAPDTIVFPILHGAEGEDGVIQKYMEDKGVAYLGSSSQSSHNCFDKGVARQILTDAGINMAAGASVDEKSYRGNPLSNQPHVLKVERGGSSIGTYLVHDPKKIDQEKVDEVFELDSLAILEELVEGNEITVPLFDGKALPVIEIIPPKDAEFDYENKYNGKTQEICPAISIDEAKQQEAQRLAEKVHNLLNCRHLSRIDMIVRPNGEIVVLEANTMPGMTNQSLYPNSAKVAGMTMPELVSKFVELVQRDASS